MKAFAAEFIKVQECNPQEGEDPTTYFPPPRGIFQTMKFENPKKRQGSLKSELKQLINSGNFDKNVVVKYGEPVIDIMEAKKIKLNQHGNLDKLKVRMCVRGDIQKKICLDMEDNTLSSLFFQNAQDVQWFGSTKLGRTIPMRCGI